MIEDAGSASRWRTVGLMIGGLLGAGANGLLWGLGAGLGLVLIFGWPG